MDLLFNRFEGINALEIAPLLTSAGALNLVFIVGIALSYLATSLYLDRRELSYLFWQSMPISDRATVMSKVVTSVLVIPAIYLAILTLGSMILFISAAVYSFTLGVELSGLVELVSNNEYCPWFHWTLGGNRHAVVTSSSWLDIVVFGLCHACSVALGYRRARCLKSPRRGRTEQ